MTLRTLISVGLGRVAAATAALDPIPEPERKASHPGDARMGRDVRPGGLFRLGGMVRGNVRVALAGHTRVLLLARLPCR